MKIKESNSPAVHSFPQGRRENPSAVVSQSWLVRLSDRQTAHPITCQVLPSLSKHCVRALYQMDMWNKCLQNDKTKPSFDHRTWFHPQQRACRPCSAATVLLEIWPWLCEPVTDYSRLFGNMFYAYMWVFVRYSPLSHPSSHPDILFPVYMDHGQTAPFHIKAAYFHPSLGIIAPQ